MKNTESPPKSRSKKIVPLKPGPKTPNQKIEIDKILQELFYRDGITPYRASIIAQCDYEYAVHKFKDWGQKLAETEEQDWIERNEAVRKRSLEGLAKSIEKADFDSEQSLKELEEAKNMKNLLFVKTLDNLKNSPIGQVLKEFDEESFKELLQLLRNYLNQYVSFSLLIDSHTKEYRANKIYASELRQQYDVIEILPPPKAVIQALMERLLAEKLKLQPAIPNPEKGT